MLERHGFEVVHKAKTVANLGCLSQLANSYIYKSILSKISIPRILLGQLFFIPSNLLGYLLFLLLPKNSDLYLGNVFLARKVGPGSPTR